MKKTIKIVGLVLILLTVLLLPLFGIYAATVSALPGEWNYPIKKNSEIIIGKFAAVSPGTTAYFSLLQSQRRYQEVLGLVDNEKDATGAIAIFLDQVEQTLFDIQSVAAVENRISFFSQYQTFLANARQTLTYKAEQEKDLLGIDHSADMKSFAIDVYEGEQGKLVTKKKRLITKNLNEKDPVPDSLIIANATSLEEAARVLSSLIQK